MQVIHKYPIEIEPEQTLSVPGGVRFLDIAIQHQRICVWALRELEDDSPRDLDIKLVGTGHEIPDTILDNWTYWKTIHVHDNLVLHVFVNYGHLIGKR